MDIQLIREWLNLLRSGEYVQTQGMLRSEDGGYCCLGVACSTYNPNAWRRDQDFNREVATYDTPFFYGNSGEYLYKQSPSAAMQKRFGFDYQLTQEDITLILSKFAYINTVAGEDFNQLLINANDEGEYTFDQIAELAEFVYANIIGIDLDE